MDDDSGKCSRCSKLLDGDTPFERMKNLVIHIFMNGRGGDMTCIGASLPGPTMLDLIAEARRERLH